MSDENVKSYQCAPQRVIAKSAFESGKNNCSRGNNLTAHAANTTGNYIVSKMVENGCKDIPKPQICINKKTYTYSKGNGVSEI